MEHHCQFDIEQLSAALDGELSSEERRVLEAHLAACPDCAALFERLSRHSAALRALDAQAPAGLKDSILSHLPPQHPSAEEPELPPVVAFPSKQTPAGFRKRWGGLVACAAVVLVVGLPFARLMLTPMGGGEGEREDAEMSAHYYTADSTAENEAVYGLDDLRGDAQLHAAPGGDGPGDTSPTADGASPGEKPAGGTTAAEAKDSGTDDLVVPDAKHQLCVGETQVAAILTLSALPEDWEDNWSWTALASEDSAPCYLVSGQVIDRLRNWAAENGTVSVSLTGESYAPDELCAVCRENP